MKGIFLYGIVMILLFSSLTFADINITSSTCGIQIGTVWNLNGSVNVSAPAIANGSSPSPTSIDLPILTSDRIIRIGNVTQTSNAGGECLVISNVQNLIIDLNGTVFNVSGSSVQSVMRISGVNNTQIADGTISHFSPSTLSGNIAIINGSASMNISTNVTIANLTIFNSTTNGNFHTIGIDISRGLTWRLRNINMSNLTSSSIGVLIRNSSSIDINHSIFGIPVAPFVSFKTIQWIRMENMSKNQYITMANTTFNQTTIDLTLYDGNTTIMQQDTNPATTSPQVGSAGTGTATKFINITNTTQVGPIANLTIYASNLPNTAGLYTTSDNVNWVERVFSYPFSGTSMTYSNFVVGSNSSSAGWIFALFGATTTTQSTSGGSTSTPPVDETIPMGDVSCGTDGMYHFTSTSNPDTYGVSYGGSPLSVTRNGDDYSFAYVGPGEYYASVYKSPQNNYRTYSISGPCGQKELQVSVATTCPSEVVVTVTDATSGAAVEGATVAKGSGQTGSVCVSSTSYATQSTDSSGQVDYAPEEFSGGNQYCFEASKSGYVAKRVDASLDSLSCGTPTISTSVNCPNGDTVLVTVKDSNGNGVEGSLTTYKSAGSGPSVGYILIDANGQGSSSISNLGGNGSYSATFTPTNHLYKSASSTVNIATKDCTTDGSGTTGTDGTGTNTGTGSDGTGTDGTGTSDGSTTQVFDLQTKDTGNVGDGNPVVATVNGNPYPDAIILVTLPNGKVIKLTTDKDGKTILPLEFAGQYKLSLVNAQGDAVKRKDVQVLAPRTGEDGTTAPGLNISEIAKNPMAIVAVIALIVIVGAYFYFRGRGGSEEGYKSKRGAKE